MDEADTALVLLNAGIVKIREHRLLDTPDFGPGFGTFDFPDAPDRRDREGTGATLHLLHVVETGGLRPDARSVLKEGELTERANEIMAEATEKTDDTSLDTITSVIEHGGPSKVI